MRNSERFLTAFNRIDRSLRLGIVTPIDIMKVD